MPSEEKKGPTDMSTEPEFAVLAEWDWVYTATEGGKRLHHLATIKNPDTVDAEWQADGVSTCGLRKRWVIPGVLSRMGMSRCAHCCARLGWPRGIGSPKNDDALRPLPEARLEGDMSDESARQQFKRDWCKMVGHNWKRVQLRDGSLGCVSVFRCAICGATKRVETWTTTT